MLQIYFGGDTSAVSLDIAKNYNYSRSWSQETDFCFISM